MPQVNNIQDLMNYSGPTNISGHRLCQNGYHYDIALTLRYASSEVGALTLTHEGHPLGYVGMATLTT